MAGSCVYSVDCDPVSASGHLLEQADVDRIAADVQALLRDDRGVLEAREALSDLATTDFEYGRLEGVLASPGTFEEWRVGEAVAEHHLSTELGCEFPWPDCRSTRNPNSSGGGVDLVGFDGGDRAKFVFAEVKTSHQQKWPPTVVTSRTHGLQTQLVGLNARDDRSSWAIKYLAMNALGKPWFERFRQALATYLSDGFDVAIYGVLLHAADPNPADLRARATHLASTVHHPTRMGLIAIYLAADLLCQLADGSISIETAA